MKVARTWDSEGNVVIFFSFLKNLTSYLIKMAEGPIEHFFWCELTPSQDRNLIHTDNVPPRKARQKCQEFSGKITAATQKSSVPCSTSFPCSWLFSQAVRYAARHEHGHLAARHAGFSKVRERTCWEHSTARRGPATEYLQNQSPASNSGNHPFFLWARLTLTVFPVLINACLV